MDRVTLRTNGALDQTIRDWAIQYLIDQKPNHPYRDALIDVLHLLWQRQEESAETPSKPSYLPLPSMCSQALGEYSAATIAVNAAWGLLYMASYVFDKTEDHETSHPIISRFGDGVSVNLASGLLLQSERILAEIGSDQVQDGTAINEVRRIFNQKALEVCAGQHLDLTNKEPSLSQIWDILEAKSGEFFALGAYLGARLVTNEPAYLETFTKVGRHLGILIQIKNDFHGLIRGEKDSGNDLTAGRRTLPVTYALHVLPTKESARLFEHLKAAPEDQSAEEEARKIILSAGVIVYLSLEAEKHKHQAIDALNSIGLDQEVIRSFSELLNYASHM